MLKKIKSFSLHNYLLILILGLATFLRFFRLQDLLGFWYDQGRDALVIWDMLYKGKLTLIGPMMGFTGMFRGGWYYWLITPFYALGQGNPIFASVFLILTTILAIFVLFVLGKKIGGVKTGLLAALIAAISTYIIGASRWLSDPTPTLLTSVLLIWSLFKFSEGKKWGLVFSGFLAGMALQFSAAAEVFYIPAIVVLIIVLRKNVKVNIKDILLTGLMFIIPFAPQLLFEMRHPGVQSTALFNFIFHEKTFTYAFWELVKTRIPFDYNMFASKFWTNGSILFAPFFVIFVSLMTFNWKSLWKSEKFKILFVMATAPLLGTLFFVSNLGGVYEYYFTGYYLIWILLFSHVYINSSKNILIKIATFAFVLILLIQNLKVFRHDYLISLNDPKIIAYGNQLNAIDWIYQDAAGHDFNVDEYVPPVIPYAYKYLFQWLGNTKYGKLPVDYEVPLLYTLSEVDPDHPERIEAWVERQKGIATVEDSVDFGGIKVERRTRIDR